MGSTAKIGGLTLRRGVWHISRVIHGRQIRMTTRCRTLEAAREFYRKWELRTAGAADSDLWQTERTAAETGRSSSLSRMLARARKRAEKKGITFSLTRRSILELALHSGGRCAVSGIPFNDATVGNSTRKPFAASLDRIDCGRGYEFDNCRLVCTCVNLAMSDYGEEALKTVARAIVAKELQAANRLQISV
jgi:hypothetical protein